MDRIGNLLKRKCFENKEENENKTQAWKRKETGNGKENGKETTRPKREKPKQLYK